MPPHSPSDDFDETPAQADYPCLSEPSLRIWLDHPKKMSDWNARHLLNAALPEPAPGRETSHVTGAGVLLLEPDRRIWVLLLANPACAARVGFPNATKHPELSLQATAIRETWLRMGLRARPVAWLGDLDTEAGGIRYYLAERTGGSPQGRQPDQAEPYLTSLDRLTLLNGRFPGFLAHAETLTWLQRSLEDRRDGASEI